MHALSLRHNGLGDGIDRDGLLRQLKQGATALLGGALFAGMLQLGGCTTPAPAPQGPLPTSGATVAAPAGCVALRQRGGAC